MTTSKSSLSLIWLDWWLLQPSRTPCRFQGSDNASKRALQCQKAAACAFWDQGMPFPQVWYHEIRNEGGFLRKKLIEKVGSLVFCAATLIKMFERLIPLGLAHVRVCVNVIKSAFFRWIARLYQVFISTPLSSESTIAWRRFGRLNFGGSSSSISIYPPFFRIWNWVRQCARDVKLLRLSCIISDFVGATQDLHQSQYFASTPLYKCNWLALARWFEGLCWW